MIQNGVTNFTDNAANGMMTLLYNPWNRTCRLRQWHHSNSSYSHTKIFNLRHDPKGESYSVWVNLFQVSINGEQSEGEFTFFWDSRTRRRVVTMMIVITVIRHPDRKHAALNSIVYDLRSLLLAARISGSLLTFTRTIEIRNCFRS